MMEKLRMWSWFIIEKSLLGEVLMVSYLRKMGIHRRPHAGVRVPLQD